MRKKEILLINDKKKISKESRDMKKGKKVDLSKCRVCYIFFFFVGGSHGQNKIIINYWIFFFLIHRLIPKIFFFFFCG